MDIDALLDLVKKRRSIRRFKPDDVSPMCIEKMLETARWAMSGANAQPWEFVVVRDKERLRMIAESWRECNQEIAAIEQIRLPEARHPLPSPTATPDFQDAPVLIILVGDKRTYQATVLSANFLATEGTADAIYFKNMANATQLLHLAAAAQGLGSMWLSVNRPWGQGIKHILGIPEILDVHTIVVVGHPAYTPKSSYRRPLTDIVHYDNYDAQTMRSSQDIYDFTISLRREQAQRMPEDSKGYS